MTGRWFAVTMRCDGGSYTWGTAWTGITPVTSQAPVPGIGSHGWHPAATCG